MFRSSTILRELIQSLAKVTLLLQHSVKLRRILCDVSACREMACVHSIMHVATIKFYKFCLLQNFLLQNNEMVLKRRYAMLVDNTHLLIIRTSDGCL